MGKLLLSSGIFLEECWGHDGVIYASVGFTWLEQFLWINFLLAQIWLSFLLIEAGMGR